MPNRIALYLPDTQPVGQSLKQAQQAEECGFEAVWQAETGSGRDAIVPLATYANGTFKIKLASGVLNTWTRNPALIAATLMTLDEVAPGRVICGLGPWHEPLASHMGIRRERPLLAIREAVQTIRALCAGRRVTFYGEFVHLHEVEFTFSGRREGYHIPIYIAATGPKLMALAGEIGDGVILNYMVSPAYNADALEQLEQGAKQAGRSIYAIDRPQLIACAMDDDGKRALDLARPLVTQYIARQPLLMRASGVPQELLDQIAQVVAHPITPEQIAEASRLVPDDVVQLVTASGTPQECLTKINAYVDTGTTCPILYPLGGDINRLITFFADGFIDDH